MPILRKALTPMHIALNSIVFLRKSSGIDRNIFIVCISADCIKGFEGICIFVFSWNYISSILFAGINFINKIHKTFCHISVTITCRMNIIGIINLGIFFLIYTGACKSIAYAYLRQVVIICNRSNLSLLILICCCCINHNYSCIMLQSITDNIFHGACVSAL